MTSILQITDLHLSPRNTLFRRNLALIRDWAAAARPGLVVATGDLSLDGAGGDADLEFAAGLLRDLPAPVLMLPGNHDVGSDPRTSPTQPVETARLARFRRIAGPDAWRRDLPGWRIIGLNSEVMGTGLAEEGVQAGFIRDATAGLGDRRLAVFLHTPVFTTRLEDPGFDYWSVAPEARPALRPLLDHPALRLVASGHLHLHHGFQLGPVRYAWAPPLSFVCEPEMQRGIPGERRTGALLHRLGAEAVETALVAPEGLDCPWLAEIRAETTTG
ncbi:metallophosphoesterase family protein [Roseicella frigidaeris]|uniref:Metallophosphoesterase n=1 Tax=Roseicella frigidaeris TaxID=2230885 RepID=A0A327M6M1_9PROT|nr:metallophosphoesterase [Roseicella frigidaeris]RAI58941.1 metallophosphoesterase [Roseicella frigidaeris]